ncbi:uncharacterized protein B0T15DRAFT_490434 [Chaetomium strumarium]|uniref:DUF7357 domain-containing protein n=1 Tax=Chaetomium strumarium TaxID=1170767 RepID=A0AAJ0GX84_9PEZI|nr:hypothetical protein B0T15DRAFT_490434 [Chaetomium strumarium]
MRDSNSLRLRLVVRRHELPETRVVFAVQLDNDPTIANLLEQVDDIIPLESNDWGLEDYVVQLRDEINGRGFDCLHFQQVSAILRDNEEVFIRPLDTGDRRKRRLSGRDQISADGRHLIDGVAFGRPRLKTPRDRPPVDIPPLKRRRITYEAENGVEEDGDQEPQFLLTQHGEDDRAGRRVRIHPSPSNAQSDGSEGHDEDEDDEFVDNDDDVDQGSDASGQDSDVNYPSPTEIDNELEGLREDNEHFILRHGEFTNFDSSSQASDSSYQLSIQQEPSRPELIPPNKLPRPLSTKGKTQILRAAFPTVSFKACGAALVRGRGDLKLAYRSLQRRHQPALSVDAMLGQSDRHPAKPAATEDAESDSEAESVASVVKHFDQHGFPSGSILAGTAAAEVAEALRKAGHAVKPPVHTRFDEDSAPVDAAQVPLPASGSENSESDSDSDSDGSPEVASSKVPEPEGGAKLSGSDGSSMSEDSDSQSGSSDESESEGESDSGNDSGSDNDDDSDHGSDAGNVGGHTDASDDDSGGGEGDSSDAEYSSSENSNSSVADSSASENESDAADSSNDDDSSDDDSSDDSADEASSQPSAEKKAIATIPLNQAAQEPGPEEPESHATSNSTATPKPVPPGQGKLATQRRNARRRAALKAQKAAARGEGLPAPDQTASQEIASVGALGRESFAEKKAALLEMLNMPSEASAKQPSQVNSKQDSQDVPGQKEDAEDDGAAKDPEAWRDKIIYRAVECCHDDMELSEPPFPFVQGWDPQQQELRGRRNQRGGRSKRKQRDQSQFLDEEGRSAAKRQKYAGYGTYGNDDNSFYSNGGDAGVDDTELNYDDEPEESAQQAEQAPEDADEEDLPPIPTDVSALPTLEPGKARPGMILTWKQWLLSKATNWQPQVSSLTGVVVDVLDDNSLKLRLARRDRKLDRPEKTYDEEGNRVYDKFELPGMEDEEGESEDEAAEQGYRTLELADMIEPRILQQPPSSAAEAPAAEGESPEPQPSGSVERSTVHDATANASDNRSPSAPDQIEAEQVSEAIGSPDADIDVAHGDQSIVSETSGAQEPAAISISDDRRHEISGLINDAGFRREVDPSVTSNVGLDLSSPSRQLEEETILETGGFSEGSQDQSQATPKPTCQATSTSNNVDSQPIYLEPFRGFSDPVSEPPVAYPKLELPPSETGSLHSGRQVDLDFSIELGEDTLHDIDDAAGESRSTLGRRSSDEQLPPRKMPTKHDSSSDSEAESSVSSVPSLSQNWASASTNRSHSPSKRDIESAIKARKSEVAPDPEYEAEMRRPEDADDMFDEENKFSQLAQELVEKPIEKRTPKKQPAQQQRNEGPKPSTTPSRIKAERASPPARIKAERATSSSSRKSPFVVPEGSQVVSLLSSSPEPELEEHYAEDSIDETCAEPSSSLPDGSGWVQKNKKKEKMKKEARPGRGLGGGRRVPPPSSAPAAVSRRAVSRESAAAAANGGGGNKERSGDGIKRSISGSPAVRDALLKARRKVFGNIL